MSACTLGIIGFGVVGKATVAFVLRTAGILNFFSKKMGNSYTALRIVVWDTKIIPVSEKTSLLGQGVLFTDATQESLELFIARVDSVIASPGVDLVPYVHHAYKFIEELDLFARFFTKPTVGITGTLGKTSITKLATKLLAMSDAVVASSWLPNKPSVVAAGNIGTAMLEVAVEQESLDVAILELSSFQLERSSVYAPRVAVVSNLFDNHLDRHRTMSAYCAAKAQLFKHQRSTDTLIVHEQCLRNEDFGGYVNQSLAHIMIITTAKTLAQLPIFDQPIEALYFDVNGMVIASIDRGIVKKHKILVPDLLESFLPDVTFASNWLLVCGILYALGRNVAAVITEVMADRSFKLDDHRYRVEKFMTAHGIDFYDDSKSTVVQATQAAVNKIAEQGRPIILILGGVGKGVDRSSLMGELQHVAVLKLIYCFGDECANFVGCKQLATLEDIVKDLSTVALPGDIVLFSPSGASFDFFNNYKHRGDVFKALIAQQFGEVASR